jgi:hypothetical protein
MEIKKIQISATANTPYVLLDPGGFIKIKGRCMAMSDNEDAIEVFKWIDSYLLSPPKTTYLVIGFEYLNSYCTTKLIELIRRLTEVLLRNRKLVISWYYEEDDADILERGEYISEIFRLPFEFVPTADIKNCF